MAKIVVRLPEPKKQYSEDNQRQINRALSILIEQLNSTYLTQQKEDQERFTWLLPVNTLKLGKNLRIAKNTSL